MVASYLRHIYLEYLFELREHGERLVADPSDPEHLHKLRTTTRRIRTLLRFFKRGIEPATLEEAKSFFRELTERTNPLRDIDVLLGDFRRYRLPPSMDGWIDPLIARVREERERRYRELIGYLRGSEFEEGLKRAYGLRFREEWEEYRSKPTIKRAVKRAKKEIREVLKEGDLHRIRIGYKRLRYLLELLRPFSRVEGKIERIKEIQDRLGRVHDMEVERLYLLEIAEKKKIPRRALLAVGKVIGDLEERRRREEKKVLARLGRLG
ncbi:MAG: CHAD domain-containing protein [Epsilonproteobacteria bacterium]|nr:hypothetical protein [Campylobacterota bacterium]NPA56314.1 CHAD domain-containing protein [Campylobacterota bacterium]